MPKTLEALLSLSLAACVGGGIMLLMVVIGAKEKGIVLETDRGNFLCFRMNKK